MYIQKKFEQFKFQDDIVKNNLNRLKNKSMYLGIENGILVP